MPTAPALDDAPVNADGENPLSNETDAMSLMAMALKEEPWAPEVIRPGNAEPTETADDSEELPPPTDEDEDTLEPSTDEEEEPEDSPPPALPLGGADPERVSQWAQIVALKPNRLSEVPPRHHNAVLAKAVEYTAQTVVQEITAAATSEMQRVRDAAYQEGLAAGRQSVSDQAREGELEALARTDPQEFAERMLENPEEMTRFATRRAAQKEGTPELLADARELLASVAGDPFAQEWLGAVEKQDPGRYKPTRQGLANLRQDIIKAQVESTLARERPASPESNEASRRKQAIERRREVPETVPTGGGNGANGKAALPDDPMELARLAALEEGKRYRR